MPAIVKDGAVDSDSWERTPLRILWLLKEFNDEGQTFSDMVGALKGFATKGVRPGHWGRTFDPVARVSYGLLHPEQSWASWARDQELYLTALRDIAVINVKKVAGGPVADWQQLEKAFEQNEPELRVAFEALQPDVVIGGNVLWLYRGWLQGWKPPRLPPLRDSGRDYSAEKVNGAIWVHAHHPANRGSHHLYYRRIRAAIETYAALKSLHVPRQLA